MARTKKAAARRAVAKQVVGISRANSKGKKKGIAQDNQPSATKAVKNLEQRQKQQAKELRRGAKLQRRKHANRQHRNGEIEWGVPPPSNLVAKLELPKSKYHSYFEFMENTERKEKKLEFEVTNKKEPYPGYKFVPIGDPLMTTKCKELSREQGAMIFIVSATTEKMSKISDHVHRIGYHFREYIVDEARKLVGETNVSDDTAPIPKTQEEINQQADAALRDLFPRIPNTDRQMILDHAFRLGAVFNGAPVVGLQPDIPLSRRVQLAVLAHIRHTHTRYDLLLRETSWENARKVVEPVCLDFIIKWRGDEETGRDQIDEILREVVVISDSEDSDDDSSDDEIDDDDDDDDDESSEEEETSSTESELIEISEPESHMQLRQKPEPLLPTHQPAAALPAYQKTSGHNVHTEKQRGFRRYQTAWEQAVSRRNHGSTVFDEGSSNNNFAGDSQNRPTATQGMHASSQLRYAEPTYGTNHRLASLSIPGQHPLHPTCTNYRQHTPQPRQYAGERSVLSRPPNDNAYYQDALVRRRTPVYMPRDENPPEVVRASPSRNLKDMLVPSIEASSDASPVRPGPVHAGFQRERYHRPAERRYLSPPARQFIVIDGSPDVKRRRVVHDDSVQSVRQPIPSVHRDFVQPGRRTPLSDAKASENIYLSQEPRYRRRYATDEPSAREPASATVQRYQEDRRGLPTALPMSYAIDSQGRRTVEITQGYHHELLEHRGQRLARESDVFVPAQGALTPASYGDIHRRSEESSDRSFITLRRADDPVPRSVERPLYRDGEARQTIVYDQDGRQVIQLEAPQSYSLRQRPLPPFPDPRQPVRRVVVLDD